MISGTLFDSIFVEPMLWARCSTWGIIGYILSAGPGSWDTSVIFPAFGKRQVEVGRVEGFYTTSTESCFLGYSGKADGDSWGWCYLRFTMSLAQNYRFIYSAC